MTLPLVTCACIATEATKKEMALTGARGRAPKRVQPNLLYVDWGRKLNLQVVIAQHFYCIHIHWKHVLLVFLIHSKPILFPFPIADKTALNNIQVQCCPVRNPALHCRPKDSWDLLLECDNLEATSDTSCTYERKIGASRGNKVSESNYVQAEIYSNIGFTLPGALIDLPVNFAANLNLSVATGYNWTSTSSETWKKETAVTIAISVPPKTRTTLYQVFGKCDFYQVRASMFKRVDSDTASHTWNHVIRNVASCNKAN